MSRLFRMWVWLALIYLSLASMPIEAEESDLPVPSLRVTVSKVWTVESAKEEAFREAPLHVDLSGYPGSDPDFTKNAQIRLQGGGRIDSRLITVFEGGRYCVKNPQQTERRYYLETGALAAVQLLKGVKAYKYAANAEHKEHFGELISVSIQVAESESFVFATNGTLLAHWIGTDCFRADGSSCGTRKRLGE